MHWGRLSARRLGRDEPIHRFCRRRAGWISSALPKQNFVDAVAVAPHCPHFRGRKHPPRLNKRLFRPLRVWNFFYKNRNKTVQISGLEKMCALRFFLRDFSLFPVLIGSFAPTLVIVNRPESNPSLVSEFIMASARRKPSWTLFSFDPSPYCGLSGSVCPVTTIL